MAKGLLRRARMFPMLRELGSKLAATLEDTQSRSSERNWIRSYTGVQPTVSQLGVVSNVPSMQLVAILKAYTGGVGSHQARRGYFNAWLLRHTRDAWRNAHVCAGLQNYQLS